MTEKQTIGWKNGLTEFRLLIITRCFLNKQWFFNRMFHYILYQVLIRFRLIVFGTERNTKTVISRKSLGFCLWVFEINLNVKMYLTVSYSRKDWSALIGKPITEQALSLHWNNWSKKWQTSGDKHQYLCW